jgi:signal transduction histidine kinase/DNA-binding response OmpR family regulator/HPt (histidine-containing phosphotransfer) domain-containing protein
MSLLGNPIHFRGNQKKFFRFGVAFGFVFPILGTVLECTLANEGTFTWMGCLEVQLNRPGIWLTDLAPIIMGFLSAFAGRLLDEVENKKLLADKRYEEMLSLRQIADRANHAKSEFLANMSHEIRTPMNAIIGMNYLLKKTELSDKQAEYNHKIEVSAKSLLRIIDDILDFSKIEAGKLTLENTPLFIEELVQEVADTVNVKLQRKKEVELVTQIDASIPAVILGDSIRLRQVLLNLADNAAKFTHQGEITIRVKLLRRVDYGIFLHFSVQDSGIGISKEQARKLFSPFQQADLSTTRKFGGTGLGLAICRKIVEMMDGELELESSLGKGSEFHFNAFFSLPVEETLPIALSESVLKGKKALLVDDSESARLVLTEMLSSMGFHVLVAKDAYEAIEIYEAEDLAHHPITLLVVDWQMPGMDGLQLVRELKAKQGQEIPAILMVTAYGLDSVKDAAKNKEVDGVMLKPINQSALHDTLIEILHLKQGKEAIKPKFDLDTKILKEHLLGKKVLLVEDKEINRELATELLNEVGIDVESAENGKVALEMVENNAYDLVLMDIQMPEMDGLTATKMIRATGRFSNLPILAMTAHAMKGEAEKSMAAGMNEHITKPIDPIFLYKTLFKYLCPHFSVDDLVQKSTSKSLDDQQHDQLILSIAGVDTKNGLNRIGNKADAYIRLLQTFANTYKLASSEIQSYFDLQKTAELSSFLHTLAGVAGNLGAQKVYQISYSLSVRLKNESNEFNWKASKNEIQEMLSELDLIISEIQKIDTSETNSHVPFADASTEDIRLKMEELKTSIEENDPAAVDICREILSFSNLTDIQKNVLLELQTPLAAFEFDQALDIIHKLS